MMARPTLAARLSRKLAIHSELREEPMFGLMSGSARGAARAESIAALRRLAARRLPKVVFDFIDGAAGDETTLRDNEAAFRVAAAASRRCRCQPPHAADVDRGAPKRNAPAAVAGWSVRLLLARRRDCGGTCGGCSGHPVLFVHQLGRLNRRSRRRCARRRPLV